MPESVLIVDDDEVVARLLARILSGQGHRCTVAHSVTEARAALVADRHTVVLCDINMPGESGLALVRECHAQLPEMAVLMVTGVDDPEVAGEALAVGAHGYLVKPFNENHVLIQFESACSRRSLERRLRPTSSVEVAQPTDREREILGLLAEGLSTDAIAERLHLRVNTVRNHVQRIIAKLGAHSRLEAVAVAIRLGLISR